MFISHQILAKYIVVQYNFVRVKPITENGVVAMPTWHTTCTWERENNAIFLHFWAFIKQLGMCIPSTQCWRGLSELVVSTLPWKPYKWVSWFVHLAIILFSSLSYVNLHTNPWKKSNHCSISLASYSANIKNERLLWQHNIQTCKWNKGNGALSSSTY